MRTFERCFFAFFCIAFLVGSRNLQAAPVSAGKALDIAQKLFASQPGTKGGAGSLSIVWDGEGISTKAVQPAFYVIARDGGGFVIIAGDDNVSPVLAISETDAFKVEGMPDNVKWWMDGLKEYVRQTHFQTPEVRGQWAAFVDTKAGVKPDTPGLEVISIHSTPRWNQGGWDELPHYFQKPVFNAKCPHDADGRLTLTGCVATALGELLTTLSGIYPDAMPASAVGQVDPYSVASGYVPAAPEGQPYCFGAEYDWEGLRTLMKTQDIKDAIAAGKDALLDNLAQLLADMGAAMESRYSNGDTGAATDRAPVKMVKHMRFNQASYFDYADHYSCRVWVEKLKKELDLRPVLYKGRSSWGGGHAFVLDGYARYDGSDMFYVNFGWSGQDNAYYLYNNFLHYTLQCGAAFDFYPTSSTSYSPRITLEGEGLRYTFDGNPVPCFGKGGSKFTLDRIENAGSSDFIGVVKLVLEDMDGNEKEDVLTILDCTGDPLLPGMGGSCVYSDVHFSKPLAFGDRLVVKFSTNVENTEWKRALVSGAPENVVWALPVYPAAFIKTKGAYAQNEWFAFELMNHDCPYAGTRWLITEPGAGSPVEKMQADREFQLTKTGTYKIQALVAPDEGATTLETIVTHITVSE